jgi:Tol biopolymer transport system component
MTHHDDFERTIVGWLADDGGRRAPSRVLDAIAAGTRTRRQAPYWIVALQGQSMGGRPTFLTPGRRRLILLVVAAALLGLLIAVGAAGRKPTNPLGAGLLAFIEHGDVFLANPDGTDARVAVHADGVAFSSVAWSPDASRLAVDGESGVVVLNSRTSTTTFVGGRNPVWSPDGRQLAVVDPPAWGTAGGTRLRFIDGDTMATLKTYEFWAQGGLAWSPNGRWIAATGDCTGPACPSDEPSKSDSVIRIDVATGEVTELDGPSGHLDAPREAAWSPDSRHIAFIRWGGGVGRGCNDPTCHTDVIVAEADGANSAALGATGSADEPSWSPDGQWVAFRELIRSSFGDPAGTGIAIERPDGSGHRQIAAGLIRGYSWSPRGDHLWFTVRDPEATAATIWETTLDGVARRLDAPVDQGATAFGGTGLPFAWQGLGPNVATPVLPQGIASTPAATLELASPIAAGAADLASAWPWLATQTTDGCNIVRVSTRDGAATVVGNLCDPEPTSSMSGSWSPDGSQYAVVRDGELSVFGVDGRIQDHIAGMTGLNGVTWSPDGTWLSVTGDHEAAILRPDGTGLLELPGIASWSPDGLTIAAPKADGTLLIGRPDGSNLRNVGAFPSPVTWSPDGSRFGFIRDGNVWTAASDGTDVRPLTTFALGGASNAIWSPDGRWIAVIATHGLWTMRSDGTEQRWLALGLADSVYEAVWSPDSSRLAVPTYSDATASGQHSRVLLVRPDGGPAVLVDDAVGPGWSPDGRFLVVTDSVPSGIDTGSLAVMNADGSGRSDLGTTGLDQTAPRFVK